MLAPIGLSTYSRLPHLQKTISALQKNTLASESELFIFSDAPKPGDEERVAAVRSYLHTVDGFKEVHIIERETNSRIANSRGGMRMLLDRFSKVIFLEEDIVTAPGFLTFMNEALEAYQYNNKVFAISGYCPSIDAHLISSDDAFLLPSCNLWGFAIWKEKFDKIRTKVPAWEILLAIGNPFSLNSYMQSGMDVPNMFLLDAQGKLDALDIKYSYEQWRRKSYLLLPRVSLTQNIGFDGTGEHCGEQQKYDTSISSSINRSFNFPQNLELNQALVKNYRKFRSVSGVTQFKWVVSTYRELIRFSIFSLKRTLATIAQ